MSSGNRQLAEVFHPGEMLQEKLDEQKMPVKEFALRCGKPEPTIHAVLKGRSAITPDMAILFENVLTIPARLWINLQSRYDEYKARQLYEQKLAHDQSWAELFPFSEMVAKGYIQPEKQCTEQDKVSTLLRFFGFSKTSIWKKYYQSLALKAEFSLSLAGIQDAYMLSAWLRYGENKVQALPELPAYSAEKFKSTLPAIQTLANNGNIHFLPQLTELCRQAGIILIHTPSLRNSRITGATRWLKGRPLIQVADTFKRYDLFWFSFFHEIGHIILHGKRDIFLEGIEYNHKREDKELEADNYASNCLIPKHVAAQLMHFTYSDHALTQLCQKEHIHLAFAVGHLHHLKKIPSSVGIQYIPMVDFSVQK